MIIDVNDLPPPPAGRAGFPWTEGSPPLPPTMPNGAAWLKVSIVTPSFRQAQYLEETIRSVLLQGYPNLEYIIIDGGSTDGSVEIIRKYEKWLAYWVSEKDKGHANALNKAWGKCTGEIWGWLNSDDVYMPGALATVIPHFAQAPDVKLVYGSAMFTNQNGEPIQIYQGKPLAPGLERLKLWKGWPLPQPSAFFARELVARYGGLDETLYYSFDAEWFLRVAQREKFICLDAVLATYRFHTQSKTGVSYANKELFEIDNRKIMARYAPLYSPKSWGLYWAYAAEQLGPVVRSRYWRLHALVRRIYGGTRRRVREYGGKLRGMSN